ncbi:hypothetical protein BdWA1_003247 [Babesia duncani]|uniref:Uncharacterized protein n=1 Tax=Babesia duncani TaxID=323732 RepID=A0AAD9PIZ9_9APIC|nr:hypothetical protein BdWA1_003247 [Babesia duncani]
MGYFCIADCMSPTVESLVSVPHAVHVHKHLNGSSSMDAGYYNSSECETPGALLNCQSGPDSNTTLVGEPSNNEITEDINAHLSHEQYRRLQLPIPEMIDEDTEYEFGDDLSWEASETMAASAYDSCCGDDLDLESLDLENNFVCKVHIALSKGQWVWCCCYFDVDGHHIQKRFDTNNISFETCKLLAIQCRRNAERNFHNNWIQRHKRLLEMESIPNDIPESFGVMLARLKNALDARNCKRCRIDVVQDILFHSLSNQ